METKKNAVRISPAKDVRHRTTWGNRFRFMMRVFSLFSLIAMAVGVLLTYDELPWSAGKIALLESASEVLQGQAGLMAQIGVGLLLVGGVFLILESLIEIVGLFVLVTGRRAVVGVNTVLQITAAVALLIGVNVISFRHYWRGDLTRDQRFTFSKLIESDLKRLRSTQPTTIVVLRKSQSDRDAYDSAAEAKVVEKVKDLVDQLREYGSQFQIVELNSEDTAFERKKKEVCARRPGLAQAIASAPENTIFFYADEKVQTRTRAEAERLAAGVGSRPATLTDPADADKALVYPANIARLPFRDFYQLDKTTSREATETERTRAGVLAGGVVFGPGAVGQGNLALISRGPEVFIRKLLTLEERKPRVGLAVIHPLLTSRESVEEYTAAGMRTALERNGFDVTDIILKKWSRSGPPTPAATTFEESELDRSEARYNLLNLLIANRETLIDRLSKDLKLAEAAVSAADAAMDVDEKRKKFMEAARIVGGYVRGRITSDVEVKAVITQLKTQTESLRAETVEFQSQVGEAGTQYRELLRNERAVESRRLVDVSAKLQQYVAETDILIVPRLTVTDIVRGDTIPGSIFNLSTEQAQVVREFMKAGKPVLFALGPVINDARGPAEGPDEVEKLLPQFGIIPGRQTILTDEESLAISERQGEGFGVAVKLSPLLFEVPESVNPNPNPISAAYRTTARAVDQKLDVKKSGYRPIYLASGVAERSPFQPEIAFTGKNSFNKDNPLFSEDNPPRYEPAKPDDPKRGTREEERRGPFPVGVAVETKIPTDWVDDKKAKSTYALSAVTGVAGLTPMKPTSTDAQLEAVSWAITSPGLGALGVGLTGLALDQVERPTVRVVALGHGGLFNGNKLDAATETLLVHTLTWQLKRDNALPAAPTEQTTWSYPRADLTPKMFTIWVGVIVLVPFVIAVLGLIALMTRQVR
ncbi:MAG: hypothetical protein ACRC8S_00235 [Fimbriiglobus sp.]